MNDLPDWDAVIRGLREGDRNTCQMFFEQHGAALEAIAGRQISRQLQRRVGADDVVQSVFRTFFRRMAGGQFKIADADAMWRLMCAITLTKSRRALRNHTRQKRGLNRESHLSEISADSAENGTDWIADRAPDPALAVEMADQLTALLSQLGEEECLVLQCKLTDLTNEEIALQLQCSERTVRRLLAKIQTQWQAMFNPLEDS